jgi:acetyl esterase/lipase
MKSPVVAYHHGTILENSDAPSLNFNASAPESLAASLGYIMVSPDYVGYGESIAHPHPYSHAKTLASASVDLLRASKKWLADNTIKTNQQLFVTGYSEGGYAAMATQKLLQESFNEQFNVAASVLAAGAYNMSETAALLAEADTLAYPVSVAFIIKNIDTIYKNNLVNDEVKADFTYIFDSYFDGTHSAGEINALLGDDPDTWLKKSFIDSLRDGTNKNFLPPMRENDIYDWTPTLSRSNF